MERLDYDSTVRESRWKTWVRRNVAWLLGFLFVVCLLGVMYVSYFAGYATGLVGGKPFKIPFLTFLNDD